MYPSAHWKSKQQKLLNHLNNGFGVRLTGAVIWSPFSPIYSLVLQERINFVITPWIIMHIALVSYPGNWHIESGILVLQRNSECGYLSVKRASSGKEFSIHLLELITGVVLFHSMRCCFLHSLCPRCLSDWFEWFRILLYALWNLRATRNLRYV